MQKQINTTTKPLIIEALNSSREGFGIYDNNDVLIFCNPTLASHFCLTPEQALGKTFAEMLRCQVNESDGLTIQNEDIDALVKRTHNGAREQGQYTYESTVFTGKCLLVSLTKSSDNELFVFTSDITQQKQTELDLRDALEKVEKLAATDPLTEVSNRRHFISQAENELARSRRQNSPATLLSMDIDHFKKINDNYGHLIGDKVLKSVAQICKKTLRSHDIFGRLGGEEFSIMLPDTDLCGGHEVAERLRENIQELNIRHNEHIIKVTASIGLCKANSDTLNLNELLSRADEALYYAKNTGRNKVELWPISARIRRFNF